MRMSRAKILQRFLALNQQDDCLDTVQAILLDPLAPTDLLESSVRSLIRYASKFFLMDGKLMRQNVQGHHKVVIPREKCYSLISRVHEAVSHRAIFSTLSYLRECFWWPIVRNGNLEKGGVHQGKAR